MSEELIDVKDFNDFIKICYPESIDFCSFESIIILNFLAINNKVSFLTGKDDIAMIKRRTGKSTLAILKALYLSIKYKKNITVIVHNLSLVDRYEKILISFAEAYLIFLIKSGLNSDKDFINYIISNINFISSRDRNKHYYYNDIVLNDSV